MVDSAAEARLRAEARAKTAAAIKPDADPLAALQASVAESKTQVGNKNLEIATIALKKALNAADPENLTQADLNAISQAVTKANVAARSVSPTENYTGRGISTDPLKLNSAIFTGTRNGIEYKNGVALNMSRADILEADRNAAEAAETANRAKTEGLLNPTVRPAGKIDKDMILYYSWIGGRTDGKWQSYRATATEENLEKYGSRVFGGQTQATFESIQGVNALIKQPLPFFKDSPDGKSKRFLGYQLDGLAFTSKGYSTTKEALDAVSSSSFTDSTFQFTDSASTTTASTTTASTTTDSFVASDGRMFNTKAAMNQYETNLVKRASRQSAFEDLQGEMAAIGLAALVEPLRGLIEQDVSASEFAIKLRDTEEYKKRFIGNQARISKGLRALTPGEYIKVEDGYRQTLRAYGLSQFDNDQYVTKFIENDISPTQLSERVSLAVDRIQNADPLIARTLREYYPSITQQDLVGYILDPSTQLPSIQQKVTTAEIGSAARRQGIEPGVSVASQLAAQGITEAQAQKGYSIIADVLPTAEKLSGLYGKSMEKYGLAEGEQDVFNELASAQRKRKNLIGREIAEFSGQSGVTRGSLGTATGGQY